MENQLLCTFTQKNFIINTLKMIVGTYSVLNNRIFIYEFIPEKTQILCTYNIDRNNCNEKKYLPQTISMHRKKDSNTFYTINALNALIVEVNNGVLDTHYVIDWNNYCDMIILHHENFVKKQRIKFKEIFYIKDKKEQNDKN